MLIYYDAITRPIFIGHHIFFDLANVKIIEVSLKTLINRRTDAMFTRNVRVTWWNYLGST